MLPVVATPLLQMLPFKSLTSNDVTDVATFPTSYINYAPSSILHPLPRRSPALRTKAGQSFPSHSQPFQEVFRKKGLFKSVFNLFSSVAQSSRLRTAPRGVFGLRSTFII
jgi:hypothetical protein